jgi:hypothetical protein
LLINHVQTAPSEIYAQTRPLTAVAQIAKIDGIGVSKVRNALYAARDIADAPEIEARFTELILRFDHYHKA